MQATFEISATVYDPSNRSQYILKEGLFLNLRVNHGPWQNGRISELSKTGILFYNTKNHLKQYITYDQITAIANVH